MVLCIVFVFESELISVGVSYGSFLFSNIVVCTCVNELTLFQTSLHI